VRAANLILMVLSFPLAYGLGYAIGATIGDNVAPLAFGIIAVLAFVALNLPVFFVQWLRGFRQ